MSASYSFPGLWLGEDPREWGESEQNLQRSQKKKRPWLPLGVSFTFTFRGGNTCLISFVLMTVYFPFCRRIREAVVSGYQYLEASVPWFHSGSQGLLECDLKN